MACEFCNGGQEVSLAVYLDGDFLQGEVTEILQKRDTAGDLLGRGGHRL